MTRIMNMKVPKSGMDSMCLVYPRSIKVADPGRCFSDPTFGGKKPEPNYEKKKPVPTIEKQPGSQFYLKNLVLLFSFEIKKVDFGELILFSKNLVH